MITQTITLGYFHNIGFSPTLLRQIQSLKHELHPDNTDDFLATLDIKYERKETIKTKKQAYSYTQYKQDIEEHSITVLSKQDADYPENLKNASTSPEILYVQWDISQINESISIVGSRKYQSNSTQALAHIIPGLVQSGLQIVSGGAIGIDTIAHKTTLTSGGVTHSILGSGLLERYPSSNQQLFEQILGEWGSILSQFPLRETAKPYNFPIRNQTVATISKWTLITQAGKKSGTCITARLAVEENRDVFIIPWAFGNESFLGSLEMIRDGVGKCVTHVDDILVELGRWKMPIISRTPDFDSALQWEIYTSIKNGNNNINDICESTASFPHELLVDLSKMEMAGYIEKKGDGYFICGTYT